MYWVIWPNKNIWEIQTPATDVKLQKKDKLWIMSEEEEKYHISFIYGYPIFLYNHTSWTDSCQNLASYWETKLNSYYFWHWVTGDFEFESIVSLKWYIVTVYYHDILRGTD